MNRYIQQLAQEYSGDCKTSFDELSKIIQVSKGKFLVDDINSFCFLPINLVFLFVYRKCLHLVKSSWNMICSKERLPLSHHAAAAATSPPSQPVSIVHSLCWVAATLLQPNAMDVPQLSQATVSHCSVHWPLTQPSDRFWSSRVSSVNCLNIT